MHHELQLERWLAGAMKPKYPPCRWLAPLARIAARLCPSKALDVDI